jgi:hypothetical protein
MRGNCTLHAASAQRAVGAISAGFLTMDGSSRAMSCGNVSQRGSGAQSVQGAAGVQLVSVETTTQRGAGNKS